MLLMVNVDDVSGETIAHVIDELMAIGAESVHVVPAITKKGRPEYLFYVDTREDLIEVLGAYLARELGTIGMRILETRHIAFQYRIEMVQLHVAGSDVDQRLEVRVKKVINADGEAVSAKADYDDIQSSLRIIREDGLYETLAFTALKGLAEQTALACADRSLGGIEAIYRGDQKS